MNKTVKKVINVVIDVIIILILLVSVMVVTLSLTLKSTGVPNIFGIAPLSVQSDSMEGTINEGDLIFSKVSTDAGDRFKVGDIVTFTQSIDGENKLNTHRIVEVVKQNDGSELYRTQGDNKERNPEPDEILKRPADILAVYTGTKIGGFGYVLSFLRSSTGFFFCILLPMIAFFIYEAIRVVLNVVAYNKEKAAEAAAEAVAKSELTEEQKQRAIAEYLAQQKAQSEETEQESDGEVQTPASSDMYNSDTPDTEESESEEV